MVGQLPNIAGGSPLLQKWRKHGSQDLRVAGLPKLD